MTDEQIPEYCDFSCPHAGFPPSDTAGICRTMSAVRCGRLEELVHKNALCEWRRRRESRSGAKRKTKRKK